jgi:DNA-binding transcriptional LysR family regulator
MDMAMELRHLRYVLTVAEEGHITRAAERLGMQQPPLSRQIKDLERELDVQLFRRTPRGVDLTDAGRIFVGDVRAVLDRLDQTVDTTRRVARGEQGRICVGVTGTTPFHPFVPRIIRTFHETFPLIAISMDERITAELFENLRHERLDVAFIRAPSDDTDGLVISPLMEEPVMVALPEDHPMARRRAAAPVPLKALAEDAFVLFGHRHGPTLANATVAACRATGFNPRIGQEVPHIGSAINLVAAGLGVAVIQASLRRMHMEGVVYRRLDGPVQLKSILNIVSRRGDPSPLVRRFLGLVKRSAKNFSYREDFSA